MEMNRVRFQIIHSKLSSYVFTKIAQFAKTSSFTEAIMSGSTSPNRVFAYQEEVSKSKRSVLVLLFDWRDISFVLNKKRAMATLEEFVDLIKKNRQIECFMFNELSCFSPKSTQTQLKKYIKVLYHLFLLDKQYYFSKFKKIFTDWVHYGKTEMLSWTLERGKFEMDNFLLSECSKYGQWEIIQTLLNKGDVNVHANNNDAIISASKNGHTNIVKMLLKHGACWREPLRNACFQNDVEMVKTLLEHGQNIRIDSELLYCTAAKVWSNEKVKILQYLIKYGADVQANDCDAFCIAAERNNAEEAEILWEHGADIHAQHDRAFKMACFRGCLGVLNFLLKVGDYPQSLIDKKINEFYNSITRQDLLKVLLEYSQRKRNSRSLTN